MLGFGVLALHIAFVGWIEVSSRPADHRLDDNAGPRTVLRLVPIATSPAQQTQAPSTSHMTTRSPAAPFARSNVPALVIENGAPLGSTEAGSAITPPSPSASAASGAESMGPSLLETEASRRAIRESALAPRADLQQNPRMTLEKKMNDAVGGDGRLVEEDLGNGRRRYRQNGNCIETTATRASQLFPEDTLPRPRLAGACP